MPGHEQRYELLKEQYDGHVNSAVTYRSLLTELHLFLTNRMDDAEAPKFLVRLRTETGSDLNAVIAGFLEVDLGEIKDKGGEGGGTALTVLTALRDRETAASTRLLPELSDASPAKFAQDFGERALARQDADIFGAGAEPFSFKFLPNGSIFRTNNATGEIEFLGNFPEAGTQAGPAPQIMQNDAGDLVAINPATGRVTVLQKGFGFAQIDPERTFALEALRTDVGFRGLELTARGQEIEAIGQDMANDILIERLAVEEARFNLNRIDSAFELRRKEREVALSFAVKQSSIRTLPSGERVTRLPFAEQISTILGVPIEEFELPVGEVNPDAAAQALLDATAFESPIPDLKQKADDTQAAIDALLDEPLTGTGG